MRRQLLTFAAILLCAFAGAAAPAGDREAVARFGARLDGLHEAARIPGLAVFAAAFLEAFPR